LAFDTIVKYDQIRINRVSLYIRKLTLFIGKIDIGAAKEIEAISKGAPLRI